MTILVELEGVVCSERKRSPIPAGELLLRMLMVSNRTVLLANKPRSEVEYYLMVHSIAGIGDILDSSVYLPDMPLRHRQIELAQSRGAIDFVVTGNPLLASWAITQKQLSTLLFSHPVFTEPGKRPERGVRAWDELVSAVDRRAVAKTQEEESAHVRRLAGH